MISMIFSWMENWKIDWYFQLTVFLFIYQLTHYGLVMPYGGTHEYGHTIQIPHPFSQARALFSADRPDRHEECSFLTVCGLPSCPCGLTWYQIASVCMHLEDVIYCPIYHLFYANFTPVWRKISPRGHFYCFQMMCSKLYASMYSTSHRLWTWFALCQYYCFWQRLILSIFSKVTSCFHPYSSTLLKCHWE